MDKQELEGEMFDLQNLTQSLQDSVEYRDQKDKAQPDLILIRIINDRLTKLVNQIIES
jgi:hypothetical protein